MELRKVALGEYEIMRNGISTELFVEKIDGMWMVSSIAGNIITVGKSRKEALNNFISYQKAVGIL